MSTETSWGACVCVRVLAMQPCQIMICSILVFNAMIPWLLKLVFLERSYMHPLNRFNTSHRENVCCARSRLHVETVPVNTYRTRTTRVPIQCIHGPMYYHIGTLCHGMYRDIICNREYNPESWVYIDDIRRNRCVRGSNQIKGPVTWKTSCNCS